MVRYIGYFTFLNGKQITYFVNVDMDIGKDEIVGYRLYK